MFLLSLRPTTKSYVIMYKKEGLLTYHSSRYEILCTFKEQMYRHLIRPVHEMVFKIGNYTVNKKNFNICRDLT